MPHLVSCLDTFDLQNDHSIRCMDPLVEYVVQYCRPLSSCVCQAQVSLYREVSLGIEKCDVCMMFVHTYLHT